VAHSSFRTRALRLLIGYLVVSVVVGVGLGFKNCYAPRQAVRHGPDAVGPRARVVRFPARDGVELEGVLVEPRGDAPMLIFCHGYPGNRDEFAWHGRIFSAAGYGVLLFDWRRQGNSTGDRITFALEEPEDLAGALDYLRALPGIGDRPVAIVGSSFGAAWVAAAANRLPPRVKALVLDSGYGDLARSLDHRVRFFGPLGRLPRWCTQVTMRRILEADAETVRPEENLRAFAPRPVLVMHGTGDRLIPPSEAEALARAHGAAELWLAEGHRHVRVRYDRPRAWAEKAADFLARNLPGAPPAGEVLAHVSRKLGA
jgi:pimeloyl-ACP methyl ester carboxylesterase